MARLIALPAEKAWDSYFVVLTQPAYLLSLINTLLLSLAVTLVSLVLGAAVGLFLARHRFAGRRMLLGVLTLPLSFPGVIIGFFVILLGGRQGLIPSLSDTMGFGRWTFAYSFIGLFLAYVYFSLPRAISAYAAAAEAIDVSLEDCARTLGASAWHIVRDVWIPELAPTTIACGAIIFATAMGAFGTAFTLASKFDVLPITIYSEFTNYANFAFAASLSISLGLVTWAALALSRRKGAYAALGL
ncbi:MAG: ABC transporter permease subunit [Betaproteobacteria bacterium]|nr:ABC transporter permease subunit [Pseudomonadota bacterium]NBO12459.1 ABC transporter permease subunit [Betaproteobacteria bacterium]NBO43965.1 ABC transporter permease subunit [Betaproteobacteria bacterium]NBP11387.1 ABC transporter permease subunit [Betaproteobacteria bacterium]NBP61791.1 ABC transporter permease subunit [Betaproteobacteria bacterium]